MPQVGQAGEVKAADGMTETACITQPGTKKGSWHMYLQRKPTCDPSTDRFKACTASEPPHAKQQPQVLRPLHQHPPTCFSLRLLGCGAPAPSSAASGPSPPKFTPSFAHVNGGRTSVAMACAFLLLSGALVMGAVPLPAADTWSAPGRPMAQEELPRSARPLTPPSSRTDSTATEPGSPTMLQGGREVAVGAGGFGGFGPKS